VSACCSYNLQKVGNAAFHLSRFMLLIEKMPNETGVLN
jgi:hypothetical protein